MTDAEKYAKVFRAAADGANDLAWSQGFVTEEKKMAGVMASAYDGIARLFERIVESERSPAAPGESKK